MVADAGDVPPGLLTPHARVLSPRGLLQAGQEKQEEHATASSVSHALQGLLPGCDKQVNKLKLNYKAVTNSRVSGSSHRHRAG